MQIQQEDNISKGAFFIEAKGERLAEMTYSKAGTDKIIIDHTEVSDALRGTGAGKKLVEAGVKYAREKGIKIIPLCPFAKVILSKGDTYKDIIS
jgi:uncharacterized protein